MAGMCRKKKAARFQAAVQDNQARFLLPIGGVCAPAPAEKMRTSKTLVRILMVRFMGMLLSLLNLQLHKLRSTYLFRPELVIV
jgi:hypothetical protein